LKPISRPAWSASLGAVVSILLVLGLVVAVAAGRARLGFGATLDVVLTMVGFLVAAGVIGAGVWATLWMARKVSARLAVGVIGLGLAGILVMGMLFPSPMTRLLVLSVVILAGWVGAAAGALLRPLPSGEKNLSLPVRRRAFAALNLGVALLASAGAVGWLVWPPGADASTEAVVEAPRPTFLGIPNPGLPGSYLVETFTYGSGTDARRPAYRDGVLFQTPSVNLAPLLPGFRGWNAGVHRSHWGFGLENTPLNAQVWMPAGTPPTHGADDVAEVAGFPLVLIIPGIDPDSERSESGYAYLGELLASRGYVVVAIDVNFLGGPRISDRAAEMPVRAWLALEHLRLLTEWKSLDPEGLPRDMDLDRIALLGHSRGGEAAALAASLNSLGRYPDDASIPMAFGFRIRGVVALAPTDRFYRPSGRGTTLSDVSYMVLHGSHDGDVLSFLGTGQYQRALIREGSDAFKASVFAVGMNHSNFNSERTGSDHPGPLGLLLDRSRLVSPAAQRAATTVFTSAFLEAVLRGDARYRIMLREPRLAGDWLPPIDFVTRFDDGRTYVLADFEGDLDPGSTSVEGGRLLGRHLTVWREETLRLRDLRGVSQENSAVRLAWDPTSAARGEPSFEMVLPADIDPAVIDPAGSLVFSLGSLSPGSGVADLSVELESTDGVRVRLPLDVFGPVPGPVVPRIWRIAALDALMTRGAEQVLQSFQIPLAVFAIADPSLDLERLGTVRFVFDRSPRGVLLLDDIGFRLPALSSDSALAGVGGGVSGGFSGGGGP